MSKILIQGYSDDSIHVHGDLATNFYPDLDETKSALLAVSDGTLVRVIYDRDGIWRLNVIYTGTSQITHVPGNLVEDTNDQLTLEGESLRWVACGNEFVGARRLPQKETE